MKPSLKLNSLHRSLLLFLLAMVTSVVFNACQVTSTLPKRASAPTPASEVSSSPQATPTANTPVSVASPPTQQQPTLDLSKEIKAFHPWKIGITLNDDNIQQVPNTHADYWFPGWQGAQKAVQDFGVQVKLLAFPACGKADQQIDCIEAQIRSLSNVIATKAADGIVIASYDSNRLVPVVEKAIAAGIPVISIDNPVNSSKILSVVTFNNFEGSKAIGEWVVKRLNGSGQVAILEGANIQKNARDRLSGFLAGLRSGNIDVLDSQHPALWDRGLAKQIAAHWLKEYPKLDAILAANDDMALGAVEAIAQAKRPDIIVTGFDGTRAALTSIQANQMQATVNQVPDQQVRIAIQLMIQHLEKGKTFPPNVFVPDIPIVTKENVNKYLAG